VIEAVKETLARWLRWCRTGIQRRDTSCGYRRLKRASRHHLRGVAEMVEPVKTSRLLS
jgi:hypothetical protein